MEKCLISYKRGYFKSKINQRNVFDKLAQSLSISKYEQWGNVTKQKIYRTSVPAKSILRHYYNNSIKTALQNIYPEINWQNQWFKHVPEYPSGFWNKKENQRIFLEEIAKELEIKETRDWGIITNRTLIDCKAGAILQKYGGSVYKTLVSVFPETTWKREWFINVHGVNYGFWKNKENQRKYFGEIAKIHKIKNPKDWGNFSSSFFASQKYPLSIILNTSHHSLKYAFGASILNYYNKSLFFTLKSVFPDISWKEEWFDSKSKKGYWKQIDNQKLFMDKVTNEYSLISPIDWKRLSLSLLKKRGGRGILEQYNNSIPSAVHNIYGKEIESNVNYVSLDQSRLNSVLFK